MHLSWLGQTCLKLQTKFGDEDVIVLLDPYKPAQGEFPRSFSPHLALFSGGLDGGATLSGDPFVVATPAECEIKEVMVTAIPLLSGGIIFKILAEGMTLLHIGRVTKKPDLAELEKIGGIDILFISVGNKESYLDPESASELVTALEPRIIIPIGYQSDTDQDAKPLSAFIKELGLKPDLTDKKIIIKKKDLPQEETKLYVLEKNV